MNWFKYRLPICDPNADFYPNPVVSGASERLISGLAEGFVVAPFSNPEEGLMTIPADLPLTDIPISPEKSHIPSSTSREDHEEEVRAIVRSLGNDRGKTVAARAIRLDMDIDLEASFDNLCSSYPDAFVFMFSSPATGTWIGASPELLLRKEGDFLSTMALAGTRHCSDADMPWDEKNRDEQALVTEFIMNTLMKHCGTVTIGKTFTKRAGPVEHICTPISAYLPNSLLADEYEESNCNRIRRILTDLSPTPAVCGNDRARSLELIRNYETFQREMYGGFCGPNGIEGVEAFYVILRSAKVSDDAAVIFAGGGITSLSSPEKEWNETELKSETILNKLKTSENETQESSCHHGLGFFLHGNAGRTSEEP